MKWIDAFRCFRQQRVVVDGVSFRKELLIRLTISAFCIMSS